MRRCRMPAMLAALGMGLLLLTGCNVPDEVKQEAEGRLSAYEQPFSDTVKDIYGSDAKLVSAECPVLMNIGSPVPEVTYRASQKLTGKIVIDRKSYEAEYDPASGKIMDTVHTEQICQELTDALPIDAEQICMTKITDNSFLDPKFPAGADSLAKVMTPDNTVCLLVNVVTTEDLSRYKDTDFNSIPELALLYQNSKFCYVRIISVKDKDRLSSLMGKLNELEISYTDTHPKIYENGQERDAFEVYHIRNTIALSQPHQYEPFRVVYTTRDCKSE